MTSGSKTFGRTPTYPLAGMAVGDTITLPAPTAADTKRIHRNLSQYGLRHDKGFRGRMNTATRIITVERVR